MQYDVHWSHTSQLNRGFHSHSIARVPPATLMGEDPQNNMADKQNRQPAIFLPHPHYTLLGLLLSHYKRIPQHPYIRVPHKDTSPVSILSSRRIQSISWNIQAPDTVLTILRFLYQCHVYSFIAYCSSKNSRSSNAVLQVGLNKRNGTHHNSFGLLCRVCGLLPRADQFWPLLESPL